MADEIKETVETPTVAEEIAATAEELAVAVEEEVAAVEEAAPEDEAAPEEAAPEEETSEEEADPEEEAAPVEEPASEDEVAPVEEIPAPSKLRPFHIIAIVLAAIALLIGAGIGLAMDARPTESLVEKRVLAEFPEWDLDNFLTGKYFQDIELWYSDTYPVREELVSMNQAIQSLYGIKPEVSFKGGDVVADELPPVAETETGEVAEEEEPPEPKTYAFEPVPMPDSATWGNDITEVLMRGLYSDNGICYGLFYFTKEAADRYIAAINLTAELLEGECDVYAIVAPMNSGIYLDDELVASLGGSDQENALAYYYKNFTDDVNVVKVFDTLKEHEDEYIYFGTDHHWTMRGAYYAYLELCDAMGLEPVDALNDWEYISYTPFQGSYATGLEGKAELTPDTVEAWIPEDTNEQVYWDWDGTLEPKGKFDIINDLNVEQQDTGHYKGIYQHEDAAGFTTFGGGDWGLVRVDNPNIHDESTLLIVKDSYGDAIYPLMVSHYEHVYVIDFRYFDYNIPQFARDYGVDDILFVNCLSVTSAQAAADILWNRIVDETMVVIEEDPELEDTKVDEEAVDGDTVDEETTDGEAVDESAATEESAAPDTETEAQDTAG